MSKRKMTATKEELRELYWEKGMTMEEIGEKFDCKKATVWKWFQRYELEVREMKKENHGSWKGGRIEKGDGRVGIHKPDHPRADSQGYVYEHTLVIKEKIGRLPEGSEQVHHINLDKKDNRPDNLVLVSGSSEHQKIHRSIDRLVPKLLDEDVIEFDRDKRRYVLKSDFYFGETDNGE